MFEKLRGTGVNIPAIIESSDDDFETISVDELLTGDTLHTLIQRVANRMETSNLVASASLFQKRYTSFLLASVLTPMTTIGTGILADATVTKIKLVNDLPARIVLKDHCEVRVTLARFPEKHQDVFCPDWTQVSSLNQLQQEVFQSLFNKNQFLLMKQITAIFGLSPKVMWGNIGNYCGYLYDLLSKQSTLYPQVKEDREAIHSLVYMGLPLKRTYRMVKLEEIEANHNARVRSSCCLWYQFSGKCSDACSTCPLISRSERVAKLTS